MTYEYLAGFFDGEGSIAISKHPYQVRIDITQKSIDVLKQIRNFLGYGLIYGKYPNKEYDVYNLQICSNKKAIKFLEPLIPHLIVKSLRARLALQYLKLKSKKGNQYTPLSKKEIRWRNMYRQLIMLCNKEAV